ncbi:hypothetical protein CWI84_09500 [Idiomarina tyrosinivorans]|uniref:Uncharacterized protein n=1 Tax=Idiomarina tyrosinivorans TaxID=1445662 RepID=A0A432ZPS3_9GAMM|nr:hypothetical protein [Idiomarina tyrosinivorans]RUO79852.1 hypothetical protein CWI84_09500 [Idiomarina tyrosinivorans]
MKASDLIWPDKWMSFGVRVSVVIVAWVLWLILSYLKYVVFHVGGILQLIGLYPLIVIWNYLFNRTIPMNPLNVEFEVENIKGQVGRTCIFVMAVIAFLGILFIGDW